MGIDPKTVNERVDVGKGWLDLDFRPLVGCPHPAILGYGIGKPDLIYGPASINCTRCLARLLLIFAGCYPVKLDLEQLSTDHERICSVPRPKGERLAAPTQIITPQSFKSGDGQ